MAGQHVQHLLLGAEIPEASRQHAARFKAAAYCTAHRSGTQQGLGAGAAVPDAGPLQQWQHHEHMNSCLPEHTVVCTLLQCTTLGGAVPGTCWCQRSTESSPWDSLSESKLSSELTRASCSFRLSFAFATRPAATGVVTCDVQDRAPGSC